MKIGYARVSTDEQDVELQVETLTKFGCETIRTEVFSGKTLKDRNELKTVLEFIREGDVLVITRIDRLARSLKDLMEIASLLEERGVGLVATEQPINTTTSMGKAFFGMLGVFAEFEYNIRIERQREGIVKARREGKYLGRLKKIDNLEIARLKDEGFGPSQIARKLNISRGSVYNALISQ